MIKKLRIKFICVNMLTVTVLLVLSLTILIGYRQKSIVDEHFSVLHRIAEEPDRKFRPSTIEENFYPPYFILERSLNGELVAHGDSLYDLSNEEELDTLYNFVLEAGKTEGVAEKYDLRYIRMDTPHGVKLVFSDMSSERATIRHLNRVSILYGIGTFVLFLAVSLLLSRWAVRSIDEAWQQQKRFVADASHELKTPLTVIISNAELLQQPGYSDAQRKDFSESILSMSQQMRHLVENLLNLARLDSIRDSSYLAELNLSSLVEDCILPFEPLYFERGLLLASEVEPDLRVRGYEPALRQCVDILLDNAQKYSETGTVHLILRRSGRQAELAVTNPSPELSKSECRDIFKRFYRRDAARTDSGSYGLGLSIAEGIVRRHDGKIACVWEDGEIRFTVTIPTI